MDWHEGNQTKAKNSELEKLGLEPEKKQNGF